MCPACCPDFPYIGEECQAALYVFLGPDDFLSLVARVINSGLRSVVKHIVAMPLQERSLPEAALQEKIPASLEGVYEPFADGWWEYTESRQGGGR